MVFFVGMILILVFFIIGLLVYLRWFQPPFYFPKPTGPYAVGSQEYHWIDAKRKEIYSADRAVPSEAQAHSNRELMVKIWYPASLKLRRASSAQEKFPENLATPYAPYFVDYLKKKKGLRGLFSWPFRSVYVYEQPGAPFISGLAKFPVIIFSHGVLTTYDIHTAQCEELASHGYIVVGINHAYASNFVRFSDGRIIEGAKSSALKMKKDATWSDIQEKLHQGFELWIADIQFVLDQLEERANDKNSVFYQRLDQKNIGIFGHSMGGTAAAHICRRDQRVKAGVDLDGVFIGPDAAKKIDKPFMVMLAEDTANMGERFKEPIPQAEWKNFGIKSPEDEKNFRALYLPFVQFMQIMSCDNYKIVIDKTGHPDFTDLALLKNSSLYSKILRTFGRPGTPGAGRANGFRVTEIVNNYLVNFFDKYLNKIV